MKTVKRMFDITVLLIVLVLLAPLFLLIALLVRLDSRGPIFYVDERVGEQGKRFKLYKFRSMVVGAEKIGLGRAAARNDPRVTRVGKFLRDYALDELPQLINVLKGDMSIVGPRPGIPAQAERYDAFQRRRLEVRPGMTGWAWIQGRNNLPWEERIKLDIWYVDHWSLWFDLYILVRSPLMLIRREGVYGKEGVTPDFKGY